MTPLQDLRFLILSGKGGVGRTTVAAAIARAAADAGLRFQSYLAAAFGIWFGLQAFINMGVNMGLLPTKGLTLPLLSYGRSSLVVTLGWIGILLRVHHETVNSRSAAARGVPR